jgi:hypothetical protein
MKLDGTTILYGRLMRLIPIATGIIGWHFASWMGVIIGFVIGCLMAVILWGTGYYFLAKARIRKQRLRISTLPTEQLQKIAIDPTSPDLGVAIGELERRGFKKIRPSLESLFELITSTDRNKWGLGLGLLFAMYPSACAKIAKEGSSSSDEPEVWRERIAAFSATN